MSTERHAGKDPDSTTIHTIDALLTSHKGRPPFDASHSLEGYSGAMRASAPGPLSDDMLAQLDAAGDAAESSLEASLWRIWPIVTGGAIALGLLAIWASVALLDSEPEVVSPTVEASVIDASDPRPFVLVGFAEGASMEEIKRTLEAHGVELESGPFPGRLYKVIVPVEGGQAFDAIAAGLDKETLVGRLVVGLRPSE